MKLLKYLQSWGNWRALLKGKTKNWKQGRFQFQHGTYPRQRLPFGICIARIQSSKYIFIYYFHYNCSLLCYDFPESTPLDEYLKNKKIVLNLDTLFVLAVDLIDAIQCLENRGIVHNNITTSTVLIAEGLRVKNKSLFIFLFCGYFFYLQIVAYNCNPSDSLYLVLSIFWHFRMATSVPWVANF